VTCVETSAAAAAAAAAAVSKHWSGGFLAVFPLSAPKQPKNYMIQDIS